MTKEILEALSAEFPEDVLSCKVQAYAQPNDGSKKATYKNATRALMVTYVSHTDVTKRLDEVCSKFGLDWEFTETKSWVEGKTEEKKDSKDNGDDQELNYVCEGKLTLKGFARNPLNEKETMYVAVSRIGVGEGKAYKDAYSDALKRAAVNFGVARYLYDQPNIWINWKQEYYYKRFTLAEVKQLVQESDNTRRQSSNRTNNTVSDLDNGRQSPPTSSELDPVLKAEIDSLIVRLGKNTREEKAKLLKEFGKPLNSSTQKEFVEFLRRKVGK